MAGKSRPPGEATRGRSLEQRRGTEEGAGRERRFPRPGTSHITKLGAELLKGEGALSWAHPAFWADG